MNGAWSEYVPRDTVTVTEYRIDLVIQRAANMIYRAELDSFWSEVVLEVKIPNGSIGRLLHAAVYWALDARLLSVARGGRTQVRC